MSFVFRRTVLTLAAAASVAGTGLANAQAAAPQAPATATTTTTVAAGGTVAELQQLLAQKRLTELRTTYNGDYGTSLLLVNEDTTAYVALSYRKELWRVYKFASVEPAEGAYDTLSHQTRAWAEDDLRRAVTAGQKAQLEREARAAEQRAASLSQDVRIMQAQRQKMLAEQQTMRKETEALNVERRAYKAQVDSLQQQIRLLEKQINDPHWSPAP
jgi:septin family protein